MREDSAFLDLWAGGNREIGGIRMKGSARKPVDFNWDSCKGGSQAHEMVRALEEYHSGCMLQCFQLRDGAWILAALQT